MIAFMKKKPRGRPATGRKAPINLSARCTKEMLRDIKALAERNRRSASAEIIIAVEAHLKSSKPEE